MMRTQSKHTLEDVLRDTHNNPEQFTKVFGPEVEKAFVRFFGDRLIGSMELPIGETVDALGDVVSVCENSKPFELFLRSAEFKETENTRDARRIALKIIEIAEKMEKRSIDLLNDQMGFIRGMGYLQINLL